MRLVMVPLVFSVACLAYVHRDKIIDQYTAAYPSDPAKEAAMQQCIEHNKNFNRLDADDRQACYRKYLPATATSVAPAPITAGPSPVPYYPYSPSHLPGNDIRRQEANNGYHPLIPSAQAEPLSPAGAVTPLPPAPSHPAQQHHHTAAHRAAALPQAH
jgi:hypothetical protein